jgi:hypothetical protein
MQRLGIHTKELPITLNMWESLKDKVSLGLLNLPDEKSCPESAIALMELKKLQLIKGGAVDHPPNFGKDRADGIARINWLINESALSIYGNPDKEIEAALLKTYGNGRNTEMLKKILPVIQKQSSVPDKKNFFFIGVSG